MWALVGVEFNDLDLVVVFFAAHSFAKDLVTEILQILYDTGFRVVDGGKAAQNVGHLAWEMVGVLMTVAMKTQFRMPQNPASELSSSSRMVVDNSPFTPSPLSCFDHSE